MVAVSLRVVSVVKLVSLDVDDVVVALSFCAASVVELFSLTLVSR